MSTALDGFLTPWIGSSYRHINAQRHTDVLDFSYAGLYGRNRWNVPGEPTLYLAGDIGVAIAEWGRRFTLSFPGGAMKPVHRDVFRLHVRLDRVLDMRNPEVAQHLKIDGGPDAFRDMLTAQAIGGHVRRTTRAQAILVPSIAFLDDLTRWNLVIYLDKMPEETSSWITRVERVGPLSWNPG